MRIKELTLYTNKLAEQKHFFENIFGFTVHQLNKDMISIQVGWTKFIFKQNNNESQLYHYCFLIPANKLHEAIQWVESKIGLVKTQDDEKIVHYENWNARSFYV